jgi:hypothetical protein
MPNNTFPVDNRADSLNIDYFQIRRRVAHEMYALYNWAELTDVQREEVNETIDDGLRNYYEPPPLPPPFALTMGLVHEWSFLRPIHKFRTATGQRVYPLPDNFERPIGSIYYQSDEDDYNGPIPFTNTTRTMKLENREEEQSPPRFASTRPAESTGIEMQKQELILHPTPDSDYALQFQYQALARRLTEDQPYPLGGQMHGPGILASCLAAAETKMTRSQGPRQMQFFEKLAGNIIRDTQRGASLMGYNGNNHRLIAYGRADLREIDGIYYNNVDYDGYMS